MQVIKDIEESGIFNYYIEDVEYMDKCVVIRLHKEESLNRVAIKELQHIADIYQVNIDIRYSSMSDSIVIVVDV